MDKTAAKTADESADFYEIVAWMHANWQKLITIAAVVLVIGAAIGFYFWHVNAREADANSALSNIKTPMPTRQGMPTPPADPQPYVAVANEYPGTPAGSHALLLAGESYFDAGKYDQAQAQFGRFLSEYPTSPLALQASLGIAASLEAQGKIADAASRYNDIILRNPGSSVLPEAKSALARLDIAQNKPEDALHLYEDLARSGGNDTWSAEAGIQAEELLAKYPKLRQAPPAPAQPAAPTMNIMPQAPTNLSTGKPAANKPAAAPAPKAPAGTNK